MKACLPRGLSAVFKALFVFLVVLFLIEAAIPSLASYQHSLPLGQLFASLTTDARLLLDDGKSAEGTELIYDTEGGFGEVIRVTPSGVASITEVTSENPDIIEIRSYSTELEGDFYLAIAKKEGEAKVRVSGETGGVKKSRVYTLYAKGGKLEYGPVGAPTVSNTNPYPGEEITVSLPHLGGAISLGAIWSTTNPEALSIKGWSFEEGKASFIAKSEGKAKLRARRIDTGELLAEITVTIGDGERLSLKCGSSEILPNADILLGYDKNSGLGDILSLFPSGKADMALSSENEDIFKLKPRTGGGYYLISQGIGSAILTLSCGDADTLTFYVTVEPKSFALPSDIAPTVSSKSPEVGERVEVALELGVPIFWHAEGEALELYSENPEAGTASFIVKSVGDITLIASTPSGNELARTSIRAKARSSEVSFSSIYSFARKLIGHFLFSLAIGACLILGFEPMEIKKRLILIGSQAAVVSVVSELIQLISGRDCKITDMLINLSGFLVGVLTAYLLEFIILKAKTKAKD